MIVSLPIFAFPSSNTVMSVVGMSMVILLFSMAVGVRAQSVDPAKSSGTMLEMCQADPDAPTSAPGWARCSGRIEGWMTAHYMSALAYGRSGSPLYCEPSVWEVGEIATVFIDWAKQNPELMHEKWSNGLLQALQKAFPCNRN